MKRIVFVVSHVGSDSLELCKILDKNPRIQFFQTNSIYDSVDSVKSLTSYPHKLNNSAAVWMDLLLYNHYFGNKCLYNFAKFIYLIREAKPTLNTIVKEKWEADYMERYYTFRLRRIYEMARKTSDAVLLTHEDLITGRGFEMIESYLNLKDSLKLDESLFAKVRSHNPLLSYDNIKRSQKSYEHYLYLIRQLPIRHLSF